MLALPVSATVPASGHSENTHNCGSCTPTPAYVKPMELAIEIAFVIFGAFQAPIALAASFCLGAAYQFILIRTGISIPKSGNGSVSCGQSNGEQYMGRGLLPYEIVLITALYFFDHIRHEPEFYVPILGFYAGTRFVWTLYTWNDGKEVKTTRDISRESSRSISPTHSQDTCNSSCQAPVAT